MWENINTQRMKNEQKFSTNVKYSISQLKSHLISSKIWGKKINYSQKKKKYKLNENYTRCVVFRSFYDPSSRFLFFWIECFQLSLTGHFERGCQVPTASSCYGKLIFFFFLICNPLTAHKGGGVLLLSSSLSTTAKSHKM